MPEQKRSWRQVEQVIAAAETRLADGGYDDILNNITSLVESAGIPNGSFYTYFSSADSVLDALRLLWVQRFQPMVERAFAEPCDDWTAVLDRSIDAVIEFFEFVETRELWLTHQLSPTALAAERASDEALGERTIRELEAIGARFLGTDVDKVVFVAILDQLVRLAFVRSGGTRPDPAYLDRARVATAAYLRPLIVPSSN